LATGNLLIGFGTFALAFALSIYGKGLLRLFCSLIAVSTGYALALAFDMLPQRALDTVSQAAPLALPQISHITFSFDAVFLVPFMLAALSSLLKTVGAVTTCQKINDQAWVR